MTVRNLGDCNYEIIFVEYEWEKYESSVELLTDEGVLGDNMLNERSGSFSDDLLSSPVGDSFLLPEFQSDSLFSSSTENVMSDSGRDSNHSFLDMNLPILDDSFGFF